MKYIQEIEQEAIQYDGNNQWEICRFIQKMKGVDWLNVSDFTSDKLSFYINLRFSDGEEQQWSIPLNYWITEDHCDQTPLLYETEEFFKTLKRSSPFYKEIEKYNVE